MELLIVAYLRLYHHLIVVGSEGSIYSLYNVFIQRLYTAFMFIERNNFLGIVRSTYDHKISAQMIISSAAIIVKDVSEHFHFERLNVITVLTGPLHLYIKCW